MPHKDKETAESPESKKPHKKIMSFAFGVLMLMVIVLVLGVTHAYSKQQDIVNALEENANPAGIDWEDDGINPQTEWFFKKEDAFLVDPVFQSEEWRAYASLTGEIIDDEKPEFIESQQELAEQVTFPFLSERADKALGRISSSNYPDYTSYRHMVSLHAMSILSKAGDYPLAEDKSPAEEEAARLKALKMAEQWTPEKEHNGHEFDLEEFDHYKEEWGLENPTDAEKEIMYKAVRKALIVAVNTYS